MPPQERLWLDNNDGLFPAPNYPGQKNQKQPVRFAAGRSFHLSPEDDELLAKERIFCDEFRLTSGKICQCAKHERGGVWFGPSEVAMVERLKAMTSQPLEKGENPMHSRRYPYVKMSESMLAIVLFLRGIGKEQETA